MKKPNSVRPTRCKTSTNGAVNDNQSRESREILAALVAFKGGDFSARLPSDWTGVSGKIADTFNDVIATNQRMARELERIRRVVGKQGKITQRASIGHVSECW